MEIVAFTTGMKGNIGKTGCGQIYAPVVSDCGLCQPVSEQEILAYDVSR